MTEEKKTTRASRPAVGILRTVGIVSSPDHVVPNAPKSVPDSSSSGKITTAVATNDALISQIKALKSELQTKVDEIEKLRNRALDVDRRIAEGEEAGKNNSNLLLSLPPSSFYPRSQVRTSTGFEELKIVALAVTMEEQGQLQPIVVGRPDNEGKRRIIAGERRWRAASYIVSQGRSFDLNAVEINDSDIFEESNPTLTIRQLIENQQRENLSLYEEAIAYQRLVDEFQMSQQKIAEVLGLTNKDGEPDRSRINKTLAVLKLPKDAQALVERGLVTDKYAIRTLSAICMNFPSALADIESYGKENETISRYFLEELLTRKLSEKDEQGEPVAVPKVVSKTPNIPEKPTTIVAEDIDTPPRDLSTKSPTKVKEPSVATVHEELPQDKPAPAVSEAASAKVQETEAAVKVEPSKSSFSHKYPKVYVKIGFKKGLLDFSRPPNAKGEVWFQPEKEEGCWVIPNEEMDIKLISVDWS